MTDDLRVGDLFTIPAAELEWRFSASGGPGGQHANRSATRAELIFDVAGSDAVPGGLRDRLLERLESRLADGVITITADESRSQWRNRQAVRRRLAELLEEAARPPRPRRPTRVPRAAKERRLGEKRRRSETKEMRKPPEAP